MSINISQRSVWMAGIVALLVFGLILTACGGAVTPTAEAPAPTEEPADAAPPVEDTPIVEEEPEPTDTPEEEMVEEVPTEESSPETETSPTEVVAEAESEDEVSDKSGTAAACLPADPNTDPIAGAILFLDEYIDAGPVNEGISPVTDADWAQGPADAAVTIVEFGDFQ